MWYDGGMAAKDNNTDSGSNDGGAKPTATGGAASSDTAQTNQNLGRELLKPLPNNEKDKDKQLAAEQLQALVRNEVNRFVQMFSADEKVKQNALFFAGTAVKQISSLAAVKDVVVNTMEKVLGIPKDVLILAQQQAQNVQLACSGSSRDVLCTLSGGAPKQQSSVTISAP